MPIIFHEGRVAAFCHVPKCAGTTVESFLTANYDHVSLLQYGWKIGQSTQIGFSVAPQHFSAADLETAYPTELLDFSVAIVRAPLPRLISEYRYSRGGESWWQRFGSAAFDAWALTCLKAARLCPNVKDNHFRPQDEMVLADAEAFRLEDGLDAVFDRFRAGLGPGRGVSAAPAINESKGTAPTVHRETAERVLSFYAGDYDRFAYEPPDLDGFEPLPGFRSLNLLTDQLARARVLAWRSRMSYLGVRGKNRPDLPRS